MSLIHYTTVGHFDPASLSMTPIRPLREKAVEYLLREFPHGVRDYVTYQEGYVRCCWAGKPSRRIGERVREFAYTLAEREGCVAAESPFQIEYPIAAKEIQADAWRRWREKNPPQDRELPDTRNFNPPSPGPCPFCGEALRTSLAKQCRFCKMDWHDPTNVYRRV